MRREGGLGCGGGHALDRDVVEGAWGGEMLKTRGSLSGEG